MMRRVAVLPLLAVALACGGGGGLFGNDESYPRTENLSVELRNTSLSNAEMWLEPDPQAGSDVPATTTETITRAATWTDAGHTITFRFHAFKPGLVRSANAEISINGHEAHAENFSGFIATWDGTTLNVRTK